jgi:flavin-dependent dehydrogenase
MNGITPSSFDVAIAGGGPAGSATALSLRDHYPSLSIVLIEACGYEAVRIGETLPPPARAILEHLGVWETFQKQNHREVHGTAAVWGSASLHDNDFIFMPANVGWHLDRAAFDRMLAREAERSGVTLIQNARVRDAKRVDNQWQLTLSAGPALSARFVVDATGGNAALAPRFGARFIETDSLVGIAGFFESGDLNNADPRTMVEAFEDGWWYTAALPDGRRLTACMTDADLARGMRLHEAKEWDRKLAALPNLGSRSSLSKQHGPIVVRSASSRLLEPVAGEHWLAVGDSASRFDPLSSQGIIKALRSGVFASYAIGDLLTKNDESGLRRYRRLVADEFKSYSEVRRKYYQEEQRWPRSEFWRRRHETEVQRPMSNVQRPVAGTGLGP